MEVTTKNVLRVLFIVVLIWVCAALLGLTPGASVRIGNTGRGKRRGCRVNPFRFVANGMVGELVPSAGSAPPAVGWPGTVF